LLKFSVPKTEQKKAIIAKAKNPLKAKNCTAINLRSVRQYLPNKQPAANTLLL